MQDQDLFDANVDLVSDRIPTPAVMLDRAYRIRALNMAYEQASLRNRAELIGEYVFDVFPTNPDDPHAASGDDKLAASFEAVLRTNSTQSMGLQRYDIPDVANEGQFVPKVWMPRNLPVSDGEKAVGIVQHVAEISDADQAVLELARAIETNRTDGEELSPIELLHTLAAFTASLSHEAEQRKALAAENGQLRRALSTRDIIGQAKGMLMERFNTDSQRAFKMLVRLSQDSNMRVADVAGRLIEVDHPPQS